jgi:hypothetical protein
MDCMKLGQVALSSVNLQRSLRSHNVSTILCVNAIETLTFN